MFEVDHADTAPSGARTEPVNELTTTGPRGASEADTATGATGQTGRSPSSGRRSAVRVCALEGCDAPCRDNPRAKYCSDRHTKAAQNARRRAPCKEPTCARIVSRAGSRCNKCHNRYVNGRVKPCYCTVCGIKFGSPNRRARYCPTCRIEVRQRLAQKRDAAVRAGKHGRLCIWCRATDHEAAWSSSARVCGACNRQRQRCKDCGVCAGPLRKFRGKALCPRCQKQKIRLRGYVEVRLISPKDDRERTVWLLPHKAPVAIVTATEKQWRSLR